MPLRQRLQQFYEAYTDAIFTRDGLLLAGVAEKMGNRGSRLPGSLQIVDPQTAETKQNWPLPEGMQDAHVVAVSPDRSHIAVAHGPDVRILQVR